MGLLAEALKEHRELLIKLKQAKFAADKYVIEKELDCNWTQLKSGFFSTNEDEEDEKAFRWIIDNPIN